MNKRILVASIIAPPLGIVALAIVLALTVPNESAGSWYEEWLGQYGGNLYLLLFFGSPIGYAVELVVGVPAYRWLVRTGRLRFAWVIVAAILGGIIATGWTAFGQPIADVAWIVLTGAFCGLVAGVAFWLAAFAAVRGLRAG